MAKYQTAREYCLESGFPVRAMMEKLVHCSLATEFCFRTSNTKTAPYYIDVQKFEKMMEAGEFKEVLEG